MSGVTKIYRRDNQPFAQIPNEAIRDPRITPNAFRLLAYVMSHSDGYELTYEQIERQTTLGRYAINQAIENLTALGWLAVDRPKASNGQFLAKSWTVLTPSSTTVGHSTVESPHMEPSTDIRRTLPKEEQEIRTVNPQAQALEDLFNEFWEFYPRKVEKLEARRAFAKAAKEVEPCVLVEGAQRLAKDPNLPEKNFIPYPASWLRAGGWTNEPYPERIMSAEEKKKIEADQAQRRRDADREASRLLKAEMAAAEERARLNPPERCEHDRIKLMCPKCR